MGVEQADDDRSRADDTVPTSEKLGAAVIYRHFEDKLKHVPIKKRKYLFQSPSPLPQISLHRGDSEQIVNIGSASDRWFSPTLISKKQVQSVDASAAIKFTDCDDGVVNEKISEVAKGKLGYSEDFSDIKMLVAAACNDSMDDRDGGIADDELVMKDSLAREVDYASSLTMPIIRKSVHEDDFHCFMPSVTSNDDRTETKSASLHVDRSHWDLNTVMDAWEQPCANLVVDSQTNVIDTVSKDGLDLRNQVKVESCKILKESGYDAERTIQSVVRTGVPSDSRNLAWGTIILNRDESKFTSYPDQISIKKENVTTSVEPALASSVFPVSGAENSTQVASSNLCLDSPPCAGSNCMTATLMSKGERIPAPSHYNIKKNKDCVSGMDLGRTFSLDTVPVEKHNFDSTCARGLEKITCERIMKKESKDSGFMPYLHDDKILLSLSMEKCQSPRRNTLDIENLWIKSGEATCISLSSPKCEYMSASVASVGDGQPVITDDVTDQDNKAFGADKTEVDSAASCSQEFMDRSSRNSCATSGDDSESSFHEPCKSCVDDPPQCSRNVLHSEELRDDRDHMVGMENMSELQEGYDSQFEDGELRDPLVQDFKAEDVKAERIDYETDRDMFDMNGAADCNVSFESSMRETNCEPCFGGSLVTNTVDGDRSKRQSARLSKMPFMTGTIRKDSIEKLEMNMEVLRGSSGQSADVDEKNEYSSLGDALKDPSHSESSKSKWSAWDQQPAGCVASSDMSEIENHGNLRGNHLIDSVNGSCVGTRVLGLRESRRGTLSSVEGPSSFNLPHRNPTAHLQQRRSSECSDLCAEDERGPWGPGRAMGRMRTSLHMRGRGRVDGRVDGQLDGHRFGMWNSRPRNFRKYDGSYDSKEPRHKSSCTNSDSKVEDANLSMYSPSEGSYRPFIRRRSTTKGHGDYHLHRDPPVRNISPDRTRGRSRRYPRRLSPKEGYFRSLPNDSDESFVRTPHNLARREQSFSPMFPGGDACSFRPHDRYLSRSRSHSPLLRLLPRDRNTGSRPLSRSPDFRSEGRTERARFQIQEAGFDPDYEVDFMSPPRRRFSPKCNPRWTEDRNRAVNNFRNRRSPARISHESYKFNSSGSSGRLKPDDYFRSAMRRGRFPVMGCAERGRKDGNNDYYRRKPVDKYQMFHPMRRYDTDDGVRRFEYDDADGFVAHDSDNQDDSVTGVHEQQRDMPRGDRKRALNLWP